MTTEHSTDPLENLSSAQTDAARAAFLREHANYRQPATVEALCDLVVRLLHKDLDQAETAAESAKWLSAQLGDFRSTALSTRAMGNVHLFRGQNSQALSCYSEACTTFSKLSDLEQVANTHLNQISALLRAGDKTQALDLADKARAIFTDLHHDLGLARLENNLGILYHRQENDEQARLHWNAAYERFLSLGKSHDATIALRNLAIVAITSNNYHEALSIYGAARELCEKQGLTLLIHEIDYNIAYLYFLRGDYDRALLGYRQARKRSQTLGDLYHAALCDLDETELYLELNLLQDASELSDRAIASFRQLQRRHEGAKALAFRGIAASRLGDPRIAIDYLRSSRTEFEAEENRAWASLVLLYEALVFQHEGRLFEARRAAEEALEGFETLESDLKIALCLLVLSQLELSEANLPAAKQSCDRAAALLRSSSLAPLQFQAFFTLGEVYDAAGDLGQAKLAYSEAEKLLETMRSNVSTEELRLPLITNRLEVYDRLLAFQMHDDPDSSFGEAFRLVEKSKARSLSDLLASRTTPLAASTPARSSLVEQVRTLREELNWYYKRFAQTDYTTTSPSTRSLETLKASLIDTEQELARSLTKVSQADFELGSLQQALTVDFERVQRQLEDDELVLEYFVGRDVVFLLSFSKNLARCEPIAVPNAINELRRLVEFQLSRLAGRPGTDVSAGASEKMQGYLRRLNSELIGPVKELVKSYSRVTVVPHSFLSYIPFPSLFDGDKILEERAAVTFSPSASSLFFNRQSTRQAGTDALEFAGTQDSRRVLQDQRDGRWKTEFVGPETPRAEWQALLKRRWSVIHLPLTAFFRQDNPVLSTIRICGQAFTVLDLFSISFQATVLVVTECGHLPGRTGTGDELLALSRSLLYSGPHVLLLPLWQTRRAPERLFLKALYGALGDGRLPLQALATARRETRKQYPHPGDWAAWVPFGA